MTTDVQLNFYTEFLHTPMTPSHKKGREPEWSNPHIEYGKLPQMAKYQIKIVHTVKGKV